MQNYDLVPLSFRITSVKNGWLFASLEHSDSQIELANSYLGGLELPKALVKACNAFLSETASSQWLCWHGESNAQIWHLQKEHDHLCLKMYSIGSSFGLPAYGDGLGQKVQRIEPNMSANVDTYVFAQSIYLAFKEYKRGHMFEQWQNTEFKNHFPEEEFQILRKLLRRNGYH